MSLKFIQHRKGLFDADFSVYHNGDEIGHLHFQGKLGSRDGLWEGSVMGHNITLQKNAKEDGFRPYDILLSGTKMGAIGMADVKSGFLSRYQFHKLKFGAQDFALYPVGLGMEGSVGCLYEGDQQIAEIRKKISVTNDLHTYDIHVTGEDNALIATLMCCYMWTLGCYRPGEQVSQSTAARVTKTTNKVLLSKYDPDFKKNNPAW